MPLVETQNYNLWGEAYGEIQLTSSIPTHNELKSESFEINGQLGLRISSKQTWNRPIRQDALNYHVHLYVRHQLLSRNSVLKNQTGQEMTLKDLQQYNDNHAYEITGDLVNLGSTIRFSSLAKWRLMIVNPENKRIYAWTEDIPLTRLSLIGGLLYLELRDIPQDAWQMDFVDQPTIVVNQNLRSLYDSIRNMDQQATLVAQSAFAAMLDHALFQSENEQRDWHSPYLRWCNKVIQEQNLNNINIENTIDNLQDASTLDKINWKTKAIEALMRHIKQKSSYEEYQRNQEVAP